MSGGTLAALATGVFGLISGAIAAVLSYRAQRNTAQADEVASAFEAYDELVKNLQAENTRMRTAAAAEREDARVELDKLRARLRDAADELGACESRCRECRGEVGDLLADLAALRSIVIDEIARSAAGQTIDEHHEHLTPGEQEELAAIRQFLDRLPPSDRP